MGLSLRNLCCVTFEALARGLKNETGRKRVYRLILKHMVANNVVITNARTESASKPLWNIGGLVSFAG
jgi:hypothetical protein